MSISKLKKLYKTLNVKIKILFLRRTLSLSLEFNNQTINIILFQTCIFWLWRGVWNSSLPYVRSTYSTYYHSFSISSISTLLCIESWHCGKKLKIDNKQIFLIEYIVEKLTLMNFSFFIDTAGFIRITAYIR